MNKYISFAILVVVIVLGIWLLVKSNRKENNIINSGVKSESQSEDVGNNKKITKEMTSAILNTNMGNITLELFEEQAPKTVANFVRLSNEKFYDGVKFHRVIKGFMIQGGDPLSKDDSKMALWGTGGPGYSFADEIDVKSDLYSKVGYKKGIVAMANSGPNTNGSQFFIMHEDYALPPLYVIFGKVTSGQDVVDKIALVKTNANDRPTTSVVLENISIK